MLLQCTVQYWMLDVHEYLVHNNERHNKQVEQYLLRGRTFGTSAVP